MLATGKDELLMEAASACIGFQTLTAARAVTRFYNYKLRSLDLQVTQFSVLVVVDVHGPATLAALAERLGADPTTLVRNVSLLERRGILLVEGTRGRSGKTVSLTSDGTSLLERALPLWYDAQSLLSAALGREQVDNGRAFMAALKAAAACA